MARLSVPPPPPIVPLKVLDPPLGVKVRTTATAVLLLMRLPPLPGLESEREATRWLTPPRSSVEPAATVRAVAMGRKLFAAARRRIEGEDLDGCRAVGALLRVHGILIARLRTLDVEEDPIGLPVVVFAGGGRHDRAAQLRR